MTHAKRVFIALMTLLTALLPQMVLADGMVIPLEADTGYLVVRHHTVTVDIEDTHAATHVDQAFYNPHPFDVTARYLFPVPPDAMVTGFTATLDGVAQTVTRQDATTTNATLYDLIATRHDPSLFQYADWETLIFELTVPAGDTRTMELSYDEVLDRRLGVMDLTAVELCRSGRIPILVFDFLKEGNIIKAIRGESVGTLIS